jgi:hypothetical protein
MAKIPFTLDAWLKDKSQKIETRNGRPVHYIGLDRAGWQVFEIFRKNGTSEYRTYHDSYMYCGPEESTYDLFIVTPEEELTEFEIRLLDWLSDDTSGEIPMERMKEVVRNRAAELLSIAREQFIKDGYVIEKKAFHDAVKKVDPEVMKEVSESVDAMNEALRLEYEKGRAEALKDLPRWKKANGKERFNERLIVLAGDNDLLCTNYAEEGEYYIPFSDLEKLPTED